MNKTTHHVFPFTHVFIFILNTWFIFFCSISKWVVSSSGKDSVFSRLEPCVCCCTWTLALFLLQHMLIAGEPSQSSAASGVLLICLRTLLETELRSDTGKKLLKFLASFCPGIRVLGQSSVVVFTHSLMKNSTSSCLAQCKFFSLTVISALLWPAWHPY